jgi:hypothetical protein
LVCSELLHFQAPVDIDFVVSPKDLTNAAKSRIKAIPKSDHNKIQFCILCQAKIKVKVKKLARKLVPGAPRKSAANAILPTKLLVELRRLAAFHCQAYVFLQCKKTKKAITHGLISEQFHGDDKKRIVGACQQLVDGHNAFGFLYNISDGDSGPERTLKLLFCGNDTSTNYVAGVHFTVKMIATTTKCNKLLSGKMI